MSANWPVEKLGDLDIKWLRGAGLRKDDIKAEGKYACIHYGELYTIHKHKLIKESDLSKTDSAIKSVSASGDILVPGTSTAEKRKMLLAREVEVDGVILGSDINIIRPAKGLFAPKFIPYFFETDDAFKQMEHYITGTTGIIHISSKGIKQLRLPVPPYKEQEKIVRILDEAFIAIDKAEANIEQNIQYAEDLFASKLNQIFEKPGQEWQAKTLGDICSRVSVGHVGKTSEHYTKSGVPFIRSQNVRKGQIDLHNVRQITKNFHDQLKKSQLKLGDILFVRVGANRGDCAAIKEDYGDINCANIVFARPKSENSEFIEYYFNSPSGRYRLLGLTTGSAQGVINTRSIEKIVIHFPTEEVQKDIVQKINKLQSKTKLVRLNYENQLEDLRSLRKSLLQKAFSGELTRNVVK